MSDQLLLDLDAAIELHTVLVETAHEIDTDRTALIPLLDEATGLTGRDCSSPVDELGRLNEELRSLADDLDNRLRMVLLGGPEINAGLWALDRLRSAWSVIDVRGGNPSDIDGTVSVGDLEWAAENLDGDVALAASWLLEHGSFFAAIDAAVENRSYLDGGPGEAERLFGDDGKISLDDIDAYLTKLDAWATLVPWMTLIDVSAEGGEVDGFMSREDFEAFLADFDLPADVEAAARQVLADSAYHTDDGLPLGVLVDVASFIPVFGDLLDGAMMLYYLSRGNWTEAAMHGIGLIPVPGLTGGSTRAGREGLEEIGERLARNSAGAVVEHPVTMARWTDHVTNPRLARPDMSPDPYHSFPAVADNYAADAQRFSLPQRAPGGAEIGTADLYQVDGSFRGTAGVFEWIVYDNEVTHRMFVPGGSVNGVPSGGAQR